MIDIDNMSEEQLLKLSEKEIQNLIDTECARQSVRLLPTMPPMPEKPDSEKDLTVHYIGGNYYTSQTDAAKIAKAINEAKSKVELSYVTGNYDYQMPQVASPSNAEPVDPNASKVFSTGTGARVKQEWVTYQVLKKEYDTAKKDFDSVNEQRKQIEDDIRGPIQKAAANERRRTYLAGEFARYEELADFDDEIAYKFICNAYDDVEDLFSGLSQLVNYTRGLEMAADKSMDDPVDE